MRLLERKKKDEDGGDEEDNSQDKKRSYLSVNKKYSKTSYTEKFRKRKEPAKPWGKKERLLVLFVLILTLGSSSFLAFKARAWKLPGLPRLKFTNPSLNLFKEEKIILEGDKDKVREIVKSNEVISNFRQITNNLSGVYGFYVTDLETGLSYGVLEEEVFQAASLIKLPVMVAMYLEEEEGSLSLSSKYKLKKSDKVAGAGSLYSKPEGYEISYQELIRLMAKQSDNTAFNIARNLLGDGKIDEIINKIGMTKTSLQKNETTPEDIGIFFEELWNGHIINSQHKDELLDFMTDTLYEEWLTAGVPVDVRVAHKYGREVHVVNDAGIVFADEPFVVVIMSKGVVEKEADEIFPKLVKEIYLIETQ